MTMIGVLLAMTLQASAPPPPPFVNVRGEVVALEASRIVVKSPDGRSQDLRLSPDWSVQVMRPMAAGEAESGRFAGVITAAGAPDRAVEAHVFSPGVRMGEGPIPWDRPAGSTLIQGELVAVEQGSSGHRLRLRYGGAEHDFTVPPDAPVVRIDNVGREHIKVGVQVFILGWPDANSGLRADAVATGEDGGPPPL